MSDDGSRRVRFALDACGLRGDLSKPRSEIVGLSAVIRYGCEAAEPIAVANARINSCETYLGGLASSLRFPASVLVS